MFSAISQVHIYTTTGNEHRQYTDRNISPFLSILQHVASLSGQWRRPYNTIQYNTIMHTAHIVNRVEKLASKRHRINLSHANIKLHARHCKILDRVATQQEEVVYKKNTFHSPQFTHVELVCAVRWKLELKKITTSEFYKFNTQLLAPRENAMWVVLFGGLVFILFSLSSHHKAGRSHIPGAVANAWQHNSRLTR